MLGIPPLGVPTGVPGVVVNTPGQLPPLPPLAAGNAVNPAQIVGGVLAEPPKLPALDLGAALPGVTVNAPALPLPQLPLPKLLQDAPIIPQVAATTNALVTSVNSAATTLTNRITDYGLDTSAAGGGPAPGISTTAITGQTFNSALSVFTISGASHLSHDGFAVTSDSGGRGRTPEFDVMQYGITLGVRADASEAFGLKKNNLTFSAFGNAGHADIDVGPSGGKDASASIDSWSAGGYALLTDGNAYGVVTIVGSWGDASIDDHTGRPSDFSTTGIATQAVGGYLIPLGETVTLDARAGVSYIAGTGDSFVNGSGFRFGDTTIDEVSGTASLKLFSTIAFADTTVRPFVQGGVIHRFDYNNRVRVEGVGFSFRDADTTLSGRVGVDFDIAKTMQGYLAVRGDKNEDLEAIAGQLGVTFKFD